MDKYEYRVKTEQMLDHLEKKDYQKAMDCRKYRLAKSKECFYAQYGK